MFYCRKSITVIKMEKQTIEIIPFGRTLDRLWSLGSRLIHFCPLEAPNHYSNHYRGANAMLEALDEPPGGIDHLLRDVPDTIEGALEIAVRENRMTPDEAAACLFAYTQTFDKSQLLESPPNQMVLDVG